ncbi:MAG: prepilin-type N-terminal cleavage/methylation domain-containing protein [Candidatus Marinimicrobia bacterium]|nr:prepilin-type N-terminal cleavage/methylation domain-containing protein [Candidatus Neomarinimicrobiota bacterium]
MQRKFASGFTLIELIISIILMGIISGLLASIIAVNFSTMAEISDRKKLVTRGMLAIDLFERELGMLKDSTNLVIADDQQIQFNDKYGNTWDYSVSSATFTRQEVGVGSAITLASPVINADTEFHYFDGDNNELTSLPLSSTNLKLVRLIKLILAMDDGGTGVFLMSIVYPENLKIYNP